MNRIMKVSGAAYTLIKRQADADQRTMIVTLDRLLGVERMESMIDTVTTAVRSERHRPPPSERPASDPVSRQMKPKPPPAPPPIRVTAGDFTGPGVYVSSFCPHCGCPRGAHREDNGRCDNHPTCRWLRRAT